MCVGQILFWFHQIFLLILTKSAPSTTENSELQLMQSFSLPAPEPDSRRMLSEMPRLAFIPPCLPLAASSPPPSFVTLVIIIIFGCACAAV